MVSSESPADQSSQPESAAAKSASSQRVRYLQICFCAVVILLAIFQFSENTTDVDLWGHVIFGQAMIKTQSIPKAEVYSWTAAGQPWVSHEVLAEVFLGGAHMLLGGNGLLLLKLAMGLLSFGIALQMGIADLTWPEKFIPWTVAALAAVEISFGFAARPNFHRCFSCA